MTEASIRQRIAWALVEQMGRSRALQRTSTRTKYTIAAQLTPAIERALQAVLTEAERYPDFVQTWPQELQEDFVTALGAPIDTPSHQ